MNKNDLRWRRTHELIKQGFIKEVTAHPFTKLTVASLIKTTGISRRAFYLHYEDKFDLLNKLEQKLIKQLQAAFNEDHRHFLQSLDDEQALWQQNYLFLFNVLSLIDQERQLFRVLLSNNGDPLFTQKLWQLVSIEIDTRVKLYDAHFTTQIPKRYAKVLIVDGVISLIRVWLDNPHPESVEHFSQILTASQLIAPLNLLQQN